MLELRRKLVPSVTLETSKPLIWRPVRFAEYANIWFIVVTLEVSQPETFKDVRL